MLSAIQETLFQLRKVWYNNECLSSDSKHPGLWREVPPNGQMGSTEKTIGGTQRYRGEDKLFCAPATAQSPHHHIGLHGHQVP